MDDQKRILVFSDAGGTGRSYHADLSAKNQSKRVHYLLEPGWKADTAIQGLGRSNRTNQAQPPLFRPVATNVNGEKRFLSTIAKRLDSLGAITRGQRQTGGQGLFRAEDNLESPYASAALTELYHPHLSGPVSLSSLEAIRERHGPSRLPRQTAAAGRIAADHNLPEPCARSADCSAEPFLRAVRGAARGAHRGRHRVRHLRCGTRDA